MKAVTFMAIESTEHSAATSDDHQSSAAISVRRMSRRAVLGQLSMGGAVGVSAWVVPQILTAKPAAAATLSGAPNQSVGTATASPVESAGPATAPSTSESTGGSTGTQPSTGSASGERTPATLSSLAATGIDVREEAEIGAVMVAAGWAIQRWASRVPSEAATADTKGPVHGAHGKSDRQ
jgi:hypothetical protein